MQLFIKRSFARGDIGFDLLVAVTWITSLTEPLLFLLGSSSLRWKGLELTSDSLLGRRRVGLGGIAVLLLCMLKIGTRGEP